jgi:hypothetical protein
MNNVSAAMVASCLDGFFSRLRYFKKLFGVETHERHTSICSRK